MIWLYLALIGLIAGVIIGWVVEWDWVASLFYGIAGVIIGCFVTLIVMLGASMIIPTLPEGDKVIENRYDLIALKDNFGYEGSFYLGKGYIDSELKYVYAIDGPEGIETLTESLGKCYLKDITDGEQCYVEEWYKPYEMNSFAKHLFGDDWIAERGKTFYVPADTIEEVYNVDLQ